MGHCPIRYCRAPIAARQLYRRYLYKLVKVLPQGTRRTWNILSSKATRRWSNFIPFATARNGMRFDNRLLLDLLFFEADKIVRVRAYLDFGSGRRTFRKNPVAA